MKTKLLLLLIFNFSFLIFNCEAATRFVSKTGTATPPYTTWATASDSIQKCINICNDGDTVVVANGVYKEYLLISRRIILMGTSMDSTIIDGTNLGDYYTLRANADITINGFNIVGKGFNSSNKYTAVGSIWYNVNVINCRISNADDAIWLGTSSGLMEGLIITNVHTGIITSCGYDTCKPIIKNCLIYLESEDADNGIVNMYNGKPTISDNIIIGNYSTEGIFNLQAIEMVIKNNLIAGNMTNIWASSVRDSTYIYNNILREQDSYNQNHASLIYPNRRAKVHNNIFTKNLKAVELHSAEPAHLDFNLYWDNEIHANTGSAFGLHDIFTDPMFVKDTTSKSFAYDYHLQEYSPAINAGDTSIFDIDGSRSDIGVFGGSGGSSYTYLNLPPKPPVNFHSSYDSSTITITWNKFSEADFSHYNIYRSSVNNFTPDSSSLYCKTDSAYFIDNVPVGVEKLYYRVTSVDIDGNESAPGEQIVITLTSAGEPLIEIIGEYKLYQNYPNPFNPVTIIPYKIKEEAYVKIMVYDIKGELIEVLVNEVKYAGYYETEFNAQNLASGIYLYRIEVVNNRSIPVYMNMQKMILLK